MKVDIVKGITILNPNDFKIMTEIVRIGNCSEPFQKRFILLDVDTTTDFLETECMGFVFSNNLKHKLYWMATGTFSHNIYEIKIYESDQKIETENGFKYFKFNELTDGILS